MAEVIHDRTTEPGACACGWRSRATTEARAEAGLRRHLEHARRTPAVAQAVALPPVAPLSLPERLVAGMFRGFQGFGWLFLRSLIIDVIMTILITAPARAAVPGWLFAVTAIVAVMIVNRFVIISVLSNEAAFHRLPHRLFGPPIFSGLVGPDRKLWSTAVAAAGMTSITSPQQFQPVIERYARLSAGKLYEESIHLQYEWLLDRRAEVPATLHGRSWDDIWQHDVVSYVDPASGESIGDLMRDPTRFAGARAMARRLGSFVELAGDLSYLTFVVLLAIAVPAALGDLALPTALQLGLAVVCVAALLLRAYLWVDLANLRFSFAPELHDRVSPEDRSFLEQLNGRRIRPEWDIRPGLDRLLRRTMSARLAAPLLFTAFQALVAMAVPVLLCLVWPGGPHRVPAAYGNLALAAAAFPVVVLAGLHFILGVIQNLRGVIVPVIGGVAAALLAGAMTVLVTGESAGLTEAVRAAWVGLPTALAAAVVSAVQRPAHR